MIYYGPLDLLFSKEFLVKVSIEICWINKISGYLFLIFVAIGYYSSNQVCTKWWGVKTPKTTLFPLFGNSLVIFFRISIVLCIWKKWIIISRNQQCVNSIVAIIKCRNTVPHRMKWKFSKNAFCMYELDKLNYILLKTTKFIIEHTRSLSLHHVCLAQIIIQCINCCFKWRMKQILSGHYDMINLTSAFDICLANDIHCKLWVHRHMF